MDTRQLARLERVVDTVYAVALVVLVAMAPSPFELGWKGDSLLAFFSDQAQHVFVLVLGMALVILYWTQSNAVFNRLARADNVFSSLALTQLVMLLFYLYVAGLSVDLGETPQVLAFQSFALLLMGVFGLAGWLHASRDGRLLAEGVTPEEARQQRLRMLPEPLAVAVTLACAPFGPHAWSLAWLSLPLLAFGLNRLARPGP